MRIPIIFLAIVFSDFGSSSPFTPAQIKNNSSLVKVIYDFSHMRDTTKPDRFYKEKMILVANKESAVYSSYSRIIQDSIAQAKLQQAQLEGSSVINMGVYVPTTFEQIKTSRSEHNLAIAEHFRHNNYLIQENLEPIKWQIENDVRKIFDYTCQKAVCTFKGRQYTAWFTTDIPLSYGPWKLNGLPGLILEAYDAKKQVNFICESISVSSNISEITFPEDGIKTTMAEYKKMVTAFRNNPDAFSSNDPNISATVTKSVVGKPVPRISMNNPIELTQ